jgi:hypothetical protein
MGCRGVHANRWLRRRAYELGFSRRGREALPHLGQLSVKVEDDAVRVNQSARHIRLENEILPAILSPNPFDGVALLVLGDHAITNLEFIRHLILQPLRDRAVPVPHGHDVFDSAAYEMQSSRILRDVLHAATQRPHLRGRLRDVFNTAASCSYLGHGVVLTSP